MNKQFTSKYIKRLTDEIAKAKTQEEAQGLRKALIIFCVELQEYIDNKWGK
jgi:hypothetical protein